MSHTSFRNTDKYANVDESICKTVRHAILNSPDNDFLVTFFEFFGDIRLSEMSTQGLQGLLKTEVTTDNLH